jgi:UDP-3-O-[3-hydroxymyristoyl] glucosamine N-acyltransferase
MPASTKGGLMIAATAQVADAAEVADSAKVWDLAQVREGAQIGVNVIVLERSAGVPRPPETASDG